MSDHPTSSLLRGAEHDRDGRDVAAHSIHSPASTRSDESTPLLSREQNGQAHDNTSPATRSIQSLEDEVGDSKSKIQRRWPTIVALSVLSAVVLVILGLGFAAPAVVEEYAKAATVFEPTDLSIDSFTTSGVRARIKGKFRLDGSRVEKKSVRDLGRAGTWIARAVESRESRVKVYLPEYDNILLGTATVPPITVDIRDGHITPIDFLTDLEPGDVDGIRRIANDWIDGRLGSLRVQGQADVPLKSGIFNLGTQSITETLLFKGS